MSLREPPNPIDGLARRLALTLLALSIVGNAAVHGLAAQGGPAVAAGVLGVPDRLLAAVVALPWWATAPVGAPPPAILAGVVHLLAMREGAARPRSTPCAGARIRMLTGPRRISVTIEWQVRFTWLDPGEGRPGDRTAEVEWSGVYGASLCKGATLVVFSDERPESTLIRALAEYKIKSVDQDDTERTWRDEHMTGWALDTLDPADPTTMPPAQAPESP